MVELLQIGALQRVLVEALGQAAADADQRRHLQVDAHARNAGQLGPQVLDDLVPAICVRPGRASGARRHVPDSAPCWMGRRADARHIERLDVGIRRQNFRRFAAGAAPSHRRKRPAPLRSCRRSDPVSWLGINPLGTMTNRYPVATTRISDDRHLVTNGDVKRPSASSRNVLSIPWKTRFDASYRDAVLLCRAAASESGCRASASG